MSKLLTLAGSEWMLNQTDQHGNTPLMMAAKYATMGVIMILLSNNMVDLEMVDNMGRDIVAMIRSRRFCVNIDSFL